MSSPRVQVRPATRADISSLMPMIQSAYRGEESRKGWTTEADILGGTRIDETALLEKIENPSGVVLLATEPASTTPIGCCELNKNEQGVGYFGLFAIRPGLQGGGLGKQVLQLAEDYARTSMGVKTLEMTVIWTRTELIDWYLRRGYVKTGVTKPFPFELYPALRNDLYFETLAKDLPVEGDGVTPLQQAGQVS